MSAAAPMPPPPPPSAFSADAVNGYDYDTHRFSPTSGGRVVDSSGSGPPATSGSHMDDLTMEAKKRIARIGPVPVSGSSALGLDK